jgi:hypothetical protein
MAQDWRVHALVYFCSAVGDLSGAVLHRALGLEFTDMTQEDIIRMAQECGLIGMRPHLDGIYQEALAAFAALVRADEREQGQKWFDAVLEQHKIDVLAERSAGVKAEREACAKVCESYLSESPHSWGGTTMAAAIRARGNT